MRSPSEEVWQLAEGQGWDVDVTAEGYMCSDAFVQRIAKALAADVKRLAALHDPDGGMVTLRVEKLRVRNVDGSIIMVSGITRLQITNLIFEHTISNIEGATLPALPTRTLATFDDETETKPPVEPHDEPTRPGIPRARPPLATSNQALKRLYAEIATEQEPDEKQQEGGGMLIDFGKVLRGLQSTSPAVRQMNVARYPQFAKMRVAQMTEREVQGEGGQEVERGFAVAEATKEFAHAFRPEAKRTFFDQKRYVLRDLATRRGTRTVNYSVEADDKVASRRAKLKG